MKAWSLTILLALCSLSLIGCGSRQQASLSDDPAIQETRSDDDDAKRKNTSSSTRTDDNDRQDREDDDRRDTNFDPYSDEDRQDDEPKEVDTKCYDISGDQIAGQSTTNSSNQRSDCYDSDGKLVYEGARQVACLDELKDRYGESILFPVSNLFPNLYDEATQQPAGQQEDYLVQKLRASTCADLLQNES